VIPAALARKGYCVQTQFLPLDICRALVQEMSQLDQADPFPVAGVGNRNRLKLAPDVRGDRIHWLEPLALTPTQELLMKPLEELRVACNRELFLGLASLEGHYAHFAPGTFYRKHHDAFLNDDARVVSAVLYLNEDWQPEDGGELRIYASEGPTLVEPRAGTLAVFLSREIEHEVLPTRKARRSFAAWFKRAP